MSAAFSPLSLRRASSFFSMALFLLLSPTKTTTMAMVEPRSHLIDMTVLDDVGSLDRFWRHHVDTQTLYDNNNVNVYPQIDACWKAELEQQELLQQYYDPATTAQRRVVRMHSERGPVSDSRAEEHLRRLRQQQQRRMKREMKGTATANSASDDSDSDDDEEEEIEAVAVEETLTTFAVIIEDAITPVHAKAVQALAKCVRQHLPHLYESRAMYKEFDLDADVDNLGGNCPTHLAPLVAVFLPEVVREQKRALQTAYDAAGWKWFTDRDMKEVNPRTGKHMPRDLVRMPPPDQMGVRASEHLTYTDFPSLAAHTDGASKYTVNFALGDPEDYQGGEFYIISRHQTEMNKRLPPHLREEPAQTFIKPKKYAAIVFLGGRYQHGVTEITGGHREMFSTEYWFYPDLPFGATLWTSLPENMERYIKQCNDDFVKTGTLPCRVPYPKETVSEYNRMEEEQEEQEEQEEIDRRRRQQQQQPQGQPQPKRQPHRQPKPKPQPQRQQPKPKRQPFRGKVRPEPLTPVRFLDENSGKTYDIDDFRPEEDEPDFLIPTELQGGEMVPIRWRDSLEPVDGPEGESFVIGFPPELHREFTKYVEQSGMMEVARSILYREKPLQDGQHRIYTLNDGNKWGAMIPGGWQTDMIWLDPADEDCFESLVTLLGRGNFDAVLDQIGKAFDLDGLMIQGVGAIFLTHKERSSNMHRDIPGSKGVFYNIIVPVYIPEDEDSTLYVGEENREGAISLDPNVGVLLGGESLHGTGECDYREQEDFRLSFAIYVADINEENVDLIASDSTSLWPTQGDTDWFWSQQGRFWSRDGTKSLKNDAGRKPLHVEDHDDDCPSKKDLCETDPLGWRLKCPKLCQLYLEDETYYSKRSFSGGTNNRSIYSTSGKASLTSADHAKAQIDWIRSKGGFFSPKLEVRRFNESDTSSPYGIFAAEDFVQDEDVLVLPRKCILTAGEESYHMCDTTYNLMKQRELGDASDFAPYVNYVFDPKHRGDVPSSWSNAGKRLLSTIIGRELEPSGVADINFQRSCLGTGHPLEEEAFLTVVRRSWDDKMLPIVDMINHRNGDWFNVDTTSAHDEDNDVRVFSRRPLRKSEQLYLSYNECSDCEGDALTYVLQDILKDYGFVEDYPRRWRFSPSEESRLVFEIDKDQDTGDLKIQWLSDPPDDFDKTFLKGHLVRLEKMRDFVHKEASKLTSAHERFTTLEFYEAMITALDYATSFQEDEGDDANDDLSATKDEVGFNMHVIEYLSRQSYERIDYMESQYNEIAFEHSDSMQDTCLYLNEHLQACSSFRPHYHEVFVHYPARYVDEVKRVAFIGGGDNFILHEILRYPSLELVVGLELDHEVVRSSFRNLGSQPHFDNEKVEWWFGDGSKSIRMLPKEYYGTFDLVLLDLQTEVVDILKVGEKHNIMDAAFMLLKPDGVMARNEDWHFGTNKPFAKYMVDLFYVDVPIIAHQGITLGSETVDFMTHPQKDHKIDTLYLEAVDESKPFKRWYNYRKTESDLSQFCKEGEIETVSGAGVLMVVEAQDAAVKSNSPDLRAKITEAIKNAGLSETSVVTVPQDEEGQSALVFALQEGYLTMRLWKDVPTYFGFELMLWDSFDKLNSVRSALLQAIESKSSSSYRMVYNDVYGSNKGTSGYSGYGPESNTCDEQFPNTPAITATGNVDQTAINSILAEIVASSEGEGNKIMVGCGEETQPCGSLDELKKAQNTQVMPVFACPGMATGNMTQEKSQSILECESSISAKLLNYATEIGAANAVYIDAGMPEAMAKAIRKVLSNKNLRRKILTKDHVALTAMLGPLEPWRRALIDRFRTEFAVFDPAFQTDILFKNAEDSLLSLGIFSSGDYDFFYHLSSTVASIEKTTNLAASIQHVKNGINNYVPDFKPSLVTSHEDYDSTEALKQWKSQQPLARQAIMQFQDKSENPSATSSAQIKDAFAETLTSVDEKYHLEEFKTPGHEECSILVAYWKDCTAVLLWNGRSVATLNLFTYDDDASLFEGLFTNKLASVSKGFVRTSQDLLPRGHGHVVNFAEDIGDEDELPHWA